MELHSGKIKSPVLMLDVSDVGKYMYISRILVDGRSKMCEQACIHLMLDELIASWFPAYWFGCLWF